MSDYKYNSLDPRYKEKISNGHETRSYESAVRDRNGKGLTAVDGKDVSGWDAYRRWLTRVQAPGKRRTPLDPGLYTWKGYRSWSEKVRRDWEPEEH